MINRMGVAAIALLAVLGACSDDSPTELRVSALGSALVAVHQDERWETLPLDDAGHATFLARGPFELVRVCANSFWTTTVAAGPSLPSESLELDCVFRDGALSVPVRVVGADRTTVALGPSLAFITPGQDAALLVDPGTYDLVAYAEGTHEMILRRGVEIGPATALTLDFSTEAIALATRPVVAEPGITNLATLRTARGTALSFIDNSGDNALWLPPASSLEPGDDLLAIGYVAGDPRGFRVQQRVDPASSAPVEVDVPPRIETFEPSPLDLGGWSARWSGAGDWDWASLSISHRVTQPWVYWDMRWHIPSREMAPAGQMVLPAFEEIPGWNSAWGMPLNGLEWVVTHHRGALTGEYAAVWAAVRTP